LLQRAYPASIPRVLMPAQRRSPDAYPCPLRLPRVLCMHHGLPCCSMVEHGSKRSRAGLRAALRGARDAALGRRSRHESRWVRLRAEKQVERCRGWFRCGFGRSDHSSGRTTTTTTTTTTTAAAAAAAPFLEFVSPLTRSTSRTESNAFGDPQGSPFKVISCRNWLERAPRRALKGPGGRARHAAVRNRGNRSHEGLVEVSLRRRRSGRAGLALESPTSSRVLAARRPFRPHPGRWAAGPRPRTSTALS
jgi:hypothetical protein